MLLLLEVFVLLSLIALPLFFIFKLFNLTFKDSNAWLPRKALPGENPDFYGSSIDGALRLVLLSVLGLMAFVIVAAGIMCIGYATEYISDSNWVGLSRGILIVAGFTVFPISLFLSGGHGLKLELIGFLMLIGAILLLEFT